jgi:D-serine deaminase-like pyridoxal phosphate-dependent protein
VTIHDLQTPQVLIDRPRLLANIAQVQNEATRHGLRLRPHAKTHKSPVIAGWQMQQGAVGICCAKLGEAEVFADAGISDIRLPYPVNPVNRSRVVRLLDRVRLSIIVDHPLVARGWSDAMRAAGRTLDVLVKVDVGLHRCGIDPALPGSLAFVRQMAGMPALRLRGLLSHAGHVYAATSEEEIERIAAHEAQLLGDLAEAARAEGLPIEEISVGATPSFRFSVKEAGITEIRPGNYVYYDRTAVTHGAAAITDCAQTVLAMVVSKPTTDRVVLDSGSKTLTTDLVRGGNPPGYGLVFSDLGATTVDESLVIERLSEEHAVVRASKGSTRLEPGDLVRVLPNHSCVVSNMVDTVQLVEGEAVIGTLPITARGQIR